MYKNNDINHINKQYKSLKYLLNAIIVPEIKGLLRKYQISSKIITEKIILYYQDKIKMEKHKNQKENKLLYQQIIRQNSVIHQMKFQVQQLMLLINSEILQNNNPLVPLINLGQVPKSICNLDIIQQQHTNRTQLSSDRNKSHINNNQIQNKNQQIDCIVDTNNFIQKCDILEDSTTLHINNQEIINIKDSNINLNHYQIKQNNQYILRENQENSLQIVDSSINKLSNSIVRESQIDFSSIKVRTQQSCSYRQNNSQFIKENKLKKNKSNGKLKYSLNKSLFTQNNQLNKNQKKNNFKKSYQNVPVFQASCQSNLVNNKEDINSYGFCVGTKKQELRYEGQKKQGLRHGEGALYYSNGLCYEGQFSQGKRQGNGVLRLNFIQVYRGNWKNDEIQGFGKIRNCAIINKNFENIQNQLFINRWTSYNGQFSKNRFHGKGTLCLQNGDKISGIFKNGFADGQILYQKKDGTKQKITMKQNQIFIQEKQN